VVQVTEERCPNCGAEVPRETGQHATTPSAGVVQCPNCGATVTLEKPGAAPAAQSSSGSAEMPRPSDAPRAPETRGGESSGEDYFSGEETVEGVMDEVREKQDG
jgi:endogenous inhibitor of DNA gyrase (YacG/DUF329 family)